MKYTLSMKARVESIAFPSSPFDPICMRGLSLAISIAFSSSSEKHSWMNKNKEKISPCPLKIRFFFIILRYMRYLCFQRSLRIHPTVSLFQFCSQLSRLAYILNRLIYTLIPSLIEDFSGIFCHQLMLF